MTNQDVIRYRSRVDTVTMVALVGAAVASILVLFTIPDHQLLVLVFVFVLCMWSIAAACIWPMEYLLIGNDLVIRCGVIRWRLPIGSIVDIAPKPRGLLSGAVAVKAALSMDQLIVHSNNGRKDTYIAISPQDKLSFLIDLQKLDPALALQVDRLQRLAV